MDFSPYPFYLCLAAAITMAASLAAPAAQTTPVAGPEVPATLEESIKIVEALVQDSKRLEVKRLSDPTSPLRIAEEYAAWIAGDVSEYADVMVTIIKRHMAAGQPVDASYLTERLPGTGSLQAHAALARHFAEKGRDAESITHQKEAETRLSQSSGQTLQKVLIDLLTAARLTDQTAFYEMHIGKMADITKLEVDLVCLQTGHDKTPGSEEAMKRVGEMQSKGVDELKARYMMAVSAAHLAKGNKEEGEVCFDEAGKHATARGLTHEYRVLLDLARLANKHGMIERAEKSMSIYLRACERFTKSAEWRAAYLTGAAETLLEWGRAEDAEKWLKSAREGASEVFVAYATEAHLSTAPLVEKMESREVADALVLEALRAGLVHPHRRAKGRAAVQTCLYYHDRGRSLPEPVLKLLRDTTADTAPPQDTNAKPAQ
jgi:tetratricopeptide (TPR) repeat protein